MSLQVIWTTAFKKDYKLAMKRGYDMDILDNVIRMLAAEETLPSQYRDHTLSGDWKGFRECHISPDWLLIYSVQHHVLTLTLTRTGTHSDLFKK